MFFVTLNIIVFAVIALLAYSTMVDAAKSLSFYTKSENHAVNYATSTSYKFMCDQCSRIVLASVLIHFVNIVFLATTLVYHFATKD